MNQFLEAALHYRRLGLPAIPTDAMKQTFVRWKDFQSRLPSENEIKKMFRSNAVMGIAIITGKISGHLEAIDIDTKNDLHGNLVQQFADIVKSKDPNLLKKLIVVQTRSKGLHLIYRCNEVNKYSCLAKRPTTAKEKQKNPKEKIRVLIETRSEGGCLMAVPTPGYKILQGNFSNIPSISSQERDILFAAARSLNTFIEPKQQYIRRPSISRPFGELSSMEDYNQRGNVIALLEKHGWIIVKQDKTRTYFRRPGETDKFSSGHFNHDLRLFKVFSRSTEFESEKPYQPYQVYTVLECNSNYRHAAKKLADEGFGHQFQEHSSHKFTRGP